ncbi:MAG: hypothetical protein ABSC00_01205 [Acidimicrobiales bacterium]|jgi:hypothetical protein
MLTREAEETHKSEGQAVADAAASAIEQPPDAEALIKEARRRQHRRYAVSAVVILLVVGLVAGLLVGRGSNGVRSMRKTITPPPPAVTVQSLGFPGPFVPDQVVSASGSVWVLGTRQPDVRGGCAIEEVDPTTLQTAMFSIPACGQYLAVGDGLIYIAAYFPTADPYGYEFHLESFDPVTKQAVVMVPVMTTALGAGTNLAFAYGGGWLWLCEGTDLLQISPSTGEPVATIADVVPSNVFNPSVVADVAGAWTAGGPSDSPADVYRITPGSRTASKVYAGSARGSVLWLSAVGNSVWADVARYGPNGTYTGSQLVELGLSGKKILQSLTEEFGDVALVGLGDQLWSVGSGAKCDNPLRLWEINAKTGRSVAVTVLHTPVEACLADSLGGPSQLTVAAGSVFALETTGRTTPASVLYRIRSDVR